MLAPLVELEYQSGPGNCSDWTALLVEGGTAVKELHVGHPWSPKYHSKVKQLTCFLEDVPLAAETPDSLQTALEQCEQEEGKLCLAVNENHLSGVVLSFLAAQCFSFVMGHDAAVHSSSLHPANHGLWKHRESLAGQGSLY